MKLAFTKEVPTDSQFGEFIQLYANECLVKDGMDPISWQYVLEKCALSVYDDGQLVGIAYERDGLHIHVRPAYEHREIERIVQKLLQKEAKPEMMVAVR